jgi:hypothetical protein
LHNAIKKLAGGTEIESTSAIPKELGRPEVAHQVWQTVKQDGGKVFARKSYKISESSRVCGYYKSQTCGQSGGQTVCCTAKIYCKENSGVSIMATKNFIQNAIKKPGALRKELGIKEGKTIPAKKLAAAAKKPGKLGQRARFAETLKGMK